MKGCELPIGVTALAVAIASQIEDTAELSLLGAAFTQLGDVLATIAAQRALQESRETGAAETDSGANKDESKSAYSR